VKSKRPFRRILLKVSGEMLAGERGFGISMEKAKYVSGEIKETLEKTGVEMAIVVGGGNIFRGMREGSKMVGRITGDYIGMLGTLINSLFLRDCLEREGIETALMGAISIDKISPPFDHGEAKKLLSQRKTLILALGTGYPYFSTDTAASLRALEIGAQVLLKGTKVDGVYDKDPESFSDAKMFERLTYNQLIERRLGVMDLTAVTLCRDNNLPIIVFNMTKKGNLLKVVEGERLGTLISKEEEKNGT